MPIYPYQSAIEPAIDLPSSASYWAFLNFIAGKIQKPATIEPATGPLFIPSSCAKQSKNYLLLRQQENFLQQLVATS